VVRRGRAGDVPDGSELRQRPTVVLVHGGPGVFDHSYFKPDFGRLAKHAQVVYLDLRGHGRSDWGHASTWSFESCADDIRVFCDTVGIVRPIVFGHSLGAPIVLLYGARHPGHAAKLIVQSGFARWDPARLVEGFRRVTGDEVAEIAGRSYSGEQVTDEERHGSMPRSARTCRMKNERLTHRRISSSIRAGPSSCIDSTSSTNSGTSTLRRSSRSANSTRSHQSARPRRSSAPCPKASRSSRSSTERATLRGWTLPTATGR
jgi:pimeloyl-ACP methyl ester carboxylesterase